VGGDLTVNRLGFGAMRITGPGIWGDPPDRDRAKEALRRPPASSSPTMRSGRSTWRP
jgi:pyridoxine 4-dehydrogenase